MNWIQIMVNIYLFLAVLLIAGITTHTFAKRGSMVSRYLLFASFTVLLHVTGYLMEFNASSLEAIMFWNQVQYFGIPFTPYFWILLALAYVMKRPLKWHIQALLAIVPLITFFSRLTNVWHMLYYRAYVLIEQQGLLVVSLDKGPFYWLNALYILIIIVTVNVLYFAHARKSPVEGQMVANRMLFGSVLLLLSTILLVSPVGGVGIDFSALFYPLAILIMAGVITRDHFLFIKPIARNRVFEQAADALLVFDQDMVLVDANPAAYALFPALNHLIRTPFDVLCNLVPDMCIITKTDKISDLRLDDNHYRVSKKALLDRLGQHVGYIVSFNDVTENVKIIDDLKAQSDQIRYLSYHDQLTGLYNRHFLESYTQDLKTEVHPLGLVFFDVNNLKEINDRFGHLEGDRLIERVASKIREICREDDVAIRVGGDEFVVLMPRMDHDQLSLFSKDWSALFKKISIRDLETSISYGFAIKGIDDTFDDAFMRAENVMYEWKRLKKDKPTT